MKKKRRKRQGQPAPVQNDAKKPMPKAASRGKTLILIGIGVGMVVLLLAGLLFVKSDTENGKPSDPNNPVVVIETSFGTIKAELYMKKATISVHNFLQYVKDRHYDATIFHRVIKDFMIQGGGFSPSGVEKPTRKPIPNESGNGIANKRGTLAMARTSDPQSASAQFFINVKDNAFLDKANANDGFGYTIFGKVFHGMSIVDKIRNVDTDSEDKPRDLVLIKSIRHVKYEE